MVTITKRETVHEPIVWLYIHESGLKETTLEFCVKEIEALCTRRLREPRKIRICVYDDVPASTGMAIGLVCENTEVLELAKEVQIAFNRLFGATYVSVSLI